MSDASSEKDLHPTATMLPWYVASVLTEEECQEIDRHLNECQDCRQELEKVRQLGQGVQAHYSSQLPDPSPRVFERVKAKILEEEVAQQQQVEHTRVQAEGSGWLQTLEEGLRSLFIPRWAPTLAMAVILAQASFLFWSISDPTRRPIVSHDPSVTERSGTPTVPTSQGILVQIAFQEQATEKDLRDIIQSLHARIVNGPSVEGVYIVELLEKDPNLVDKKLQAVLSQSSLVRLARRVK